MDDHKRDKQSRKSQSETQYKFYSCGLIFKNKADFKIHTKISHNKSYDIQRLNSVGYCSPVLGCNHPGPPDPLTHRVAVTSKLSLLLCI